MSCSSAATRRANELCDSIAQAKGNTERLQEIKKSFHHICKEYGDDSIHIVKSMMEIAADGNDTLQVATAYVVSTPQTLGRWFASRIQALSITPDTTVKDRINSMNKIIAACHKSDTIGIKFANALQSTLDSIPMKEQMRIYTIISSPSTLGKALANDLRTARRKNDIQSISTTLDRIKIAYSIYHTQSTEKGEIFLTFFPQEKVK